MSDTPDNEKDESPRAPDWTIRTDTQFRIMVTNDDGQSRACMTVGRATGAAVKNLSIYDSEGAPIVIISLLDGTVDLQQPGKAPEAAEKFWRAIASQFPVAGIP